MSVDSSDEIGSDRMSIEPVPDDDKRIINCINTSIFTFYHFFPGISAIFTRSLSIQVFRLSLLVTFLFK